MRKVCKSFVVLVTVFVAVLVCGCSANFTYSVGTDANGNYDSSLFYRNDLNFIEDTPDPGVLYVDEGEYGGYFYLYTTNTPIKVYRTANFADIEFMGYCFEAAEDAWSFTRYWAPEVIRNPVDGKYYMYYTAAARSYHGATELNDCMQIGVAVSDTPVGPFHEWEGERRLPKRDANGNRVQDENGEDIFVTENYTRTTMPFDFMQSPVAKQKEFSLFAAIDASPFFDDNGDLYLYFAKHVDHKIATCTVWGIKMIDMVTPDYDTLTMITDVMKVTPDADTDVDTETNNAINEGPSVLKHTTVRPDGTSVSKYYLTYSILGYANRMYSVCTAVSDSPLGTFTKLGSAYGQPMHGINADFDHMSGTAHHQFCTAGDEMFIVYHAHKDRTGSSSQRAIAFDRVDFVYNEALGFDILHSNGPTYSLQPQPAVTSGYKNIASEAQVKATNATNDVRLLTDGLVAVHNYDEKLEFRTTGKTKITLSFPSARTVRAIMVYNSYEYDLAFASIEKIQIKNAGGKKYTVKDLAFPIDYVNSDASIMRPGGAAVVTFDEMAVTEIEITISDKISDTKDSDFQGIAVSDIAVLGK